jgi:hypothetical protein
MDENNLQNFIIDASRKNVNVIFDELLPSHPYYDINIANSVVLDQLQTQ